MVSVNNAQSLWPRFLGARQEAPEIVSRVSGSERPILCALLGCGDGPFLWQASAWAISGGSPCPDPSQQLKAAPDAPP